jgi:hypoxanthine phosphoribosyltransferase
MTDGNEIERVLISRQEIAERVKELGTKISEDYKGMDLVLAGVLKGGFVVLSDLMRVITIPLDLDLIAVSSYGAKTKSSGVVMLVKDLDVSIENKHVLIVEDIIDTGLTLSYLVENFKTRHPKSVKICALLSKPERRKADITVDYIGFTIPDVFVVGYGLDFNNKYRQLPDICVLKPEAYK